MMQILLQWQLVQPRFYLRSILVLASFQDCQAFVPTLPRLYEVTLVERADRLGGHVRRLGTTFPHGEPGEAITDRLEAAVRAAGRASG